MLRWYFFSMINIYIIGLTHSLEKLNVLLKVDQIH